MFWPTGVTQWFFDSLGNQVVAVTEWEMGDREIELVLRRLASQTVMWLSDHMEFRHVEEDTKELENIYGLTSQTLSDVRRIQEAAGSNEHLCVYVVSNVGRENWCLLTRQYTTLKYILECDEKDCMIVEKLVRRQGKQEKIYCKLVPRLVPSKGLSLWESFAFHQTEIATVCQMLPKGNGETRDLMEPSVQYYLVETDLRDGWCMMAGLDLEKGLHMALGRLSSAHPVVMTVRKKEEARNFLHHMRVYVRHRLSPIVRGHFLSRFTRINPITWDEADQIVWGELSLQESAYQRVCQRLPMEYLKGNASQRLATIVGHIRAITSHFPPIQFEPSFRISYQS